MKKLLLFIGRLYKNLKLEVGNPHRTALAKIGQNGPIKNGLTFILLLITYSCYSQITCPPHVPEFTFYYTRPLINGQAIDSVNYCDPEGQQVSWNITQGNDQNIFSINDGVISINDATIINGNPLSSYVITIQVIDPGELSSYSIINLMEINSPPVIISY